MLLLMWILNVTGIGLFNVNNILSSEILIFSQNSANFRTNDLFRIFWHFFQNFSIFLKFYIHFF